MDKFFSFFGKFAVILLVVGILVTGGYYLGTGKLPFPTNPTPGAVTTIVPTPTPTPTDERAITPTIVASPSAAAAPVQTISGGGPKGATFSPFTINVPTSWTVTRDDVPNTSYKLTLTQGSYAIVIYQTAAGANPCVYPGDPPQDMSISFGPYTAIHDSFGNNYRRATPAGRPSGFTVCQQGPAYFNTSTMYGLITYTAPASPDPAILSQMDAIFTTLKN